MGLHAYFFEDKPLFGLDIGHDTLRVVQFDMRHKKPRMVGYGSVLFDTTAIEDGVIVKPELIAKPAVNLFHKGLIGDIATKRVAVALPGSKALSRAVQLPKLSKKEMDEAVHAQVEQYLPGSADNLYMDYTTIRENKDGVEVFVVAMPKKIVDSYLALTRLLGLDAVLLDTTIGAAGRLFAQDRQSDVPSLIIDFGAQSADITVFNRGLVVTGTVPFGGDDITRQIAASLHVTPREALMLKSKYGLSKSVVQKQIAKAIEQSMEELLKEIRRSIRYYEQRYDKETPIGQVVIMGGGSNMPGLADYLTDRLRLPARTFDPSEHINFGHLRPFYRADRMSYVTAAGLAVTNPTEIFK